MHGLVLKRGRIKMKVEKIMWVVVLIVIGAFIFFNFRLPTYHLSKVYSIIRYAIDHPM